MSGGAAVSLADAAERFQMSVPELPDHIQQAILERVPHGSAAGPIDLTGKVLDDHSIFPDTVDAVVESGTYDSIVAFQAVTGITPQHRSFITDTWSAVRRRHPDLPVAVVSVFDAENRRFLDDIGCMAFEEPTRAVRALSALAWFHEAQRRPPSQVEPLARPPVLGTGAQSESQALRFIEQAGIPVVPHAAAVDADAAAAEADRLGYPVALKVLSADIAHKSDVGGVELRLRDTNEVRAAFAEIMRRVHEARPDAAVEGALVAPMVRDGVECILGGLVDPVFGPIVMFGLGGIHVEVLHDVAFRRAPLDSAEALRMIGEIRSGAVLDGVRGRPAADRQALADALVRLSQLISANAGRLASIEINPFIVQSRGGFAVDALIVPGSGGN
ncbi:MAG: acetate--CoA ligase family protein, partial [Burkholderiaceae bacterium]